MDEEFVVVRIDGVLCIISTYNGEIVGKDPNPYEIKT